VNSLFVKHSEENGKTSKRQNNWREQYTCKSTKVIGPTAANKKRTTTTTTTWRNNSCRNFYLTSCEKLFTFRNKKKLSLN